MNTRKGARSARMLARGRRTAVRWAAGASALAVAVALAAPALAQDAGPPSPQTPTAGPHGAPGTPPTTGTPASGGASQPASDSHVGEVVVTAEFRAQNLQSTPIAITALNAEQLRQRSITSVIDVAQEAPNVTMTLGSGGFGNTNQATIRGIGQNDFSFAFEPRVGFYIDDVYYATTFGSVFDLLDVDRVEVERGPQGTLNGRNSVGGAIRIFTKQPRGDNSGYIEGSYGSFKHEAVRGAFDVAVVPDKLMVRLAGGWHRQDGWVDRYNFPCLYPGLAGKLPKTGLTGREGCKVGTLGGTNVWDVRGQLRWVINERLEDNVTVDFTDDRSEAPADTLLAIDVGQNPNRVSGNRVPAGTPNGLALWLNNVGGPIYGLPTVPIANRQVGTTPQLQTFLGALQSGPYSSYAIFGNPGMAKPAEQMSTPPINYVRHWGISNVIDFRLTPSINLKSITAYREYTGEFGTSQSQIGLPIQEVYNTVAHHQWSQELRLTGEAFHDRLDWALGGFYLSTFNENAGRIDDEGFATYIPALGELPFLFDQTVDDKSSLQNESAFLHGVYHFTPQLSLEGGVRYSHEIKNYSYYRHYFTGQPDANITAAETSISRWNPRVALDFQATPLLLLYASYSTGFTAGGFDPRPFAAADANLPFAPEDVKSYEVGFKSTLLDHRLRLNASAFFTDWKNIQLMLSGCAVGCPTSSPFYYGNGGNAHIKGFEVETEATPLPGLLITASVGYSNFRYVTLNQFTNLSGDPTALTLDSPGVRAPRWKLSAGMQYRIDLGSVGSLTPRLDYIVQSRVYFGPDRHDPLTYQSGYSLLNARLTWQGHDPNWSVSGYVTNLTDKLYYTFKTDQLNSFGTAAGTVAPPREFGVTIRRQF